MHDYITSLFTALDIKEPDINMAGSFSGYTGVHNINSRMIVLINWSRRFLGGTNFLKDIHQEPSSLGRSYSSNKLCFCGTQCIYQLSFGPINNCTPVKRKRKFSSVSPLGRIIDVCIIHKYTSVLPYQYLAWVWGSFRTIKSDFIWVL